MSDIPKLSYVPEKRIDIFLRLKPNKTTRKTEHTENFVRLFLWSPGLGSKHCFISTKTQLKPL